MSKVHVGKGVQCFTGCVFLNATSGTYFYFDTQSVFEALKVENIFKRLDRNEKAAARSTVSRSTRTRGKAYKHGRIHLISSRRSFTVSGLHG
ncbi:hypothetical protein Bca4012_074887 [Brassica carinata]